MTTASSVRTSWPGPPRRRRRAERVRWNGMRLLLGLIVIAVGCVAVISFIQAVAFPGRSTGARPVDIASLLPGANVSAPTTAEPTAQVANSGAVVRDAGTGRAGGAAPARQVVAGSPAAGRTSTRPSPVPTTRAPRRSSADDPPAGSRRSAPVDDDEPAEKGSDPEQDDSGDRSGPADETEEPTPDRDDSDAPATGPGGSDPLPALECAMGRVAEEIRSQGSDDDEPDPSDCR